MAKKKSTSPISLLPIQGQWQFDRAQAKYIGPDDPAQPVGLCLAASRFRSGLSRVKAQLSDNKGSARVVVGFNSGTGGYYSIGLGGYDFAYVVDLFTPGRGWAAVGARGSSSQLQIGRQYDLAIEVRGQRASLSVDGVGVLTTPLPSPLQGDQAGLFAWGTSSVVFSDFQLSANEPQLFVVMQFGDPYDGLYEQVIEPVSNRLGFKAFRADDLFRPGVILEDIRRGILEADVIVAEITPANPNVFYELGYAHALDKPTILLANRNTPKLPFDISGYRVIFYDDTITGKGDIEDTLKKYLESITAGHT